jgi:hypothetical protein
MSCRTRLRLRGQHTPAQHPVEIPQAEAQPVRLFRLRRGVPRDHWDSDCALGGVIYFGSIGGRATRPRFSPALPLHTSRRIGYDRASSPLFGMLKSGV